MKHQSLLLGLLLISSTWLDTVAAQPSAADIHHRLRRLRQTVSVLYVAAHPDDENTRLITWMSKEKAYKTSYVSLTRGDGGQNLIGSELGVELGMIRTRELMAARAIDGGEQYFTSAVDFGYSKSADETLLKWDHQRVLEDLVRVVRTVQPDLIICRFPPDKRAGHGHHAASAILAAEAFSAAADTTAFPIQPGAPEAWQAKRIVWNTYRFGSNNTIAAGQPSIDAGGYDPISGFSNGELASLSRSQHKSQGFGVAMQRGAQKEYFSAIAGDTAFTDPFSGFKDRWDDYHGGPTLARMLDKLISEFSFLHPDQSVQDLLKVRRMLMDLPQDRWVQWKMRELESILIDCIGFWGAAYSRDESVVTSDTFTVDVQLLVRNPIHVSYRIEPMSAVDTIKKGHLTPQEITTFPITLAAPSQISQPFWLQQERADGCFGKHKGGLSIEPWNPASIRLPVQLTLGEQTLLIELPVEHKRTDPVKGELIHDITVTPLLSGTFNSDMIVFRDTRPRKIKLELDYHGKGADSLTLQFEAGGSLQTSISDTTLFFSKANSKKALSFSIFPRVFKPGERGSLAIRILSSGKPIDTLRQHSVISYDHVPEINWFPPCNLRSSSVELADTKGRVVYLKGAGDKIAPILEQLGYEVITTDANGLLNMDIKGVKAIVTGIRAYNTDKQLPLALDKMLEFIRSGGRLVVQYNTNSNLHPGTVMAPYPFTITRNRTTEEDAPVLLTDTTHVLFNYPNRIRQQDFSGWIQERGLYYANEIAPEYADLIRMSDKGEEAVGGSLICAPYGKGQFIYTGLSFFRQVPDGNPGAIRLLSNLIGN